jgi:predicted metal-dependent phosphoesterase TrpH
MQRVEFHCHTIHSKDSLTHPQDLIDACRRKGIQRVIITDHNSIAGALIARDLDPERVIVGEEIMTTQGELLAAFVQEEIPAGLTPNKTIKLLREQGAFISVSHPYDYLRGGHWKPNQLSAIADQVDAIEVFNARCLRPSFNQQAGEFANNHHLPGTVGSDAHAAFELGKATLLLPEFRDADELRAVIDQARQDVSMSGPWVRLVSRYAVLYKKLFNPTY